MRILYHSAVPWAETGYGRCTKEIVPRLQDAGHEVAIQCLQSVTKGPVYWHGENLDRELEEPIRVYPATTSFGLGNVEKNFQDFGGDLYHTHFDTWMGVAAEKIPSMGIPYTSYVIVDHDRVPKALLKQTSMAQEIFAMSEYAESKLDDKVVNSTAIPHGVDHETFHPIPSDEMPTTEIVVEDEDGNERAVDTEETFIVGIFAANHDNRKNIPEQMEAFESFDRRVDGETLLYMHMDQKSDTGFDLHEVRSEVGIPSEKIVWRRNQGDQTMPDEEMNLWYNVCDVTLNCSKGESWGLTVTEAMAAGTPVIGTMFTSIPEQLGTNQYPKSMHYIRDNVWGSHHGLLVEPAQYMWKERVAARHAVIDPMDVCKALIYYYKNEGEVEEHGLRAREFVENNYTWDNHVCPMFVEEFDKIEAKLNG